MLVGEHARVGSDYGMFGLGRLGQHGMLHVNATLDGKPLAGAEIEVTLRPEGRTETGKTDATGVVSFPYGEQDKGALVRFFGAPVSHADIGEEADVELDLPEGSASHTFALKSLPATGAPIGGIIAGLGIIGIIVGNILLKKY